PAAATSTSGRARGSCPGPSCWSGWPAGPGWGPCSPTGATPGLSEAAGPGRGRGVGATHARGHDNLDLEVCTARGVLATNTPDVVTEATADLAWALLLAAARRGAEGERFLRARQP